MRRRYLILVAIVGLLFAAMGGAAAAIASDLTQTIAVTYGDVSYVESDLQVNSYSENGPGIVVQTVDVTIENTGSNSITANTSVYLMDGNTVISSGYTSGTSWSSGETKTVIVDVDDVKQKDYTQVDIQVVEQ